jgi:hypothetical protein
MKTLRTIATIMLAVFMVLGPVAAFAAGETVTVSTNSPTYSGNATIQVSGTVTPAPTTATTAVVITTKGPMGVVDSNVATVATGTGAFNYAFVAGSSMFVSGTYTVNATYGGPGGSGSGTTTFVYNGIGTTTGVTSTVTVTSTITTAVSTATVTSTIASADSAQLTAIQTSLAGITSALSVLTTGFGTINTGIQALQTSVNALSTPLNTLQSGVTALGSQLTSISNNITAVNNIGPQMTSLTNAVNTNQTYVLVVAALAAITLVLELAILVRKLS